MSSGNRDDRPALIALALLLVAVLLAALIALGNEYVAQHYAANYSAPDYEGGNGDVRAVLSALREFDPLEDSLAQWSMAFLAAVATILSIVGVVLLRRTFEETKRTADAARKANKLARKAFTADQRPWIKLSKINAVKVQLDATGRLAVMASVQPENLGKTPALRVVLQCKLERINAIEPDGVEEALDEFCETCRRTFEIGRNVAIFPQEQRGPLIEMVTLEGFRIEQTPVALRLFLCVAYMPSNDRYAMFHTGALVTLDFGARIAPPPGSGGEPLFGNITVRDIGNVYSVS